MGIYNPIPKAAESSNTAANITNSLSTTESTLCPANSSRKGLTIYNSTSETMLVSKVTGVTTSAFGFRLEPKQFYSHPMQDDPYTGTFYAILESGTGAAQVQETA